MKKYCLDMTVSQVVHINEKYVLLKLTHEDTLPEMVPGQFVEVRVDGSPTTFLRRPISINNVDTERNELHLLVACIGDGTKRLGMLKEKGKRLLVGGGVGVAPLLYLGRKLKEEGVEPTFLLGARSAKDLLLIEDFKAVGRVFVTTEDGSEGEKGFVTDHTIWKKETYDIVSTCGPSPMMKAVARKAKEKGVKCEVSLENRMACGVGACLCCVEKVKDKGNVCVCTEGPVFYAEQLW